MISFKIEIVRFPSKEYIFRMFGSHQNSPLAVTTSHWKLLLYMSDVTCQCHWWLSVARGNSIEGEKWKPLAALGVQPRIRAFHSLSIHILQILLILPLKYIQNPTTFNKLYPWFWFDLILRTWLSVIAGKKQQNVILGTYVSLQGITEKQFFMWLLTSSKVWFSVLQD